MLLHPHFPFCRIYIPQNRPNYILVQRHYEQICGFYRTLVIADCKFKAMLRRWKQLIEYLTLIVSQQHMSFCLFVPYSLWLILIFACTTDIFLLSFLSLSQNIPSTIFIRRLHCNDIIEHRKRYTYRVCDRCCNL